jgi:hypothetical protein
MAYRYRRKMTAAERATLAVAAVVAVGATGGAAVHHYHRVSVPAGSAYTQASWARALLRADSDPRTRCNLDGVTAWERAEGGHFANAARYNPLDSTMREPGSWSMNPVGVQAYPSWRAGFRATLATLHNGLYGNVLAALRAGDSAQAIADAVAASPWGTQPFTARCA